MNLATIAGCRPESGHGLRLRQSPGELPAHAVVDRHVPAGGVVAVEERALLKFKWVARHEG